MKHTRNILILIAAVSLLSSCATMNLKTGTEAYEQMQYQESIKFLEKGLAKKEDYAARKMLANAYLSTGQYKKAHQSLMIMKDYPESSVSEKLELGQSLMSFEQYDEAAILFRNVLDSMPDYRECQNLLRSCEEVEAMKEDSLLFDVSNVNLSDMLSSTAAVPYESGIIFTGTTATMGAKDPYNKESYTNLFYAEKSGEGFSEPAQIKALDAKFHDGYLTLSPDKQTAVLTRSNYDKRNRLIGDSLNFSNTQIYITYKDTVTGDWTQPEKMSFNQSEYLYAHPAFSSDGQTLYFSSNMAGGYGGMDLYETTLVNGSWTTPLNLGYGLNTAGNEVFPTCNQTDTLYFSSNAQLTLGGLDILYCVKQGENWSTPVHLTAPINSSADDFSMNYIAGTKDGYFSSNRSGKDEIYAFHEYNNFLELDGLIVEEESLTPLDSVLITVTNLSDNSVFTVSTNPDGTFELPLPKGEDYSIMAEKDGYFSKSLEVSTKGIKSDEPIMVGMELSKLIIAGPEAAGVAIAAGTPGLYDVPNIYWDFDKWEVREDSKPYLDELAKKITDNPNLTFEIRSHCDDRGTFEYNDKLSERRAKAVSVYLIKKGVNPEKIHSKGFGKRQPINTCSPSPCTRAQHQENRRTEFVVLEKQ